jgi:hypothetical protein
VTDLDMITVHRVVRKEASDAAHLDQPSLSSPGEFDRSEPLIASIP